MDLLPLSSPRPKTVLCFPKEKLQQLKGSLFAFIDNWRTTLFMTFLTLYALFADDIRQLSCDKDTDQVVWYITSVVMCIFLLEILLSSFAKPDYFLSFFFWLDVVSTVSMLLDIGWFSNWLFPSGRSGGLSNASLVRAARASQIGSRAGRIVRILRIIRLIRIIRLYKVSEQANINEKIQTTIKTKEKKKAKAKDSLSPPEITGVGKMKTKSGRNVIANEDQNTQNQPRLARKSTANEEMLPPELAAENLGASRLSRKIGAGVSSKERTKSLFLKNIEVEKIKLLHQRMQGSKGKTQPGEPEKVEDSLVMNQVDEEDELEGRKEEKPNSDSLTEILAKEKYDEDPEIEDEEILDGEPINEENQVKAVEQQNIQNQIAMVERQMFEETNVGRKLSEAMTKKIVIIVLILMTCIPLFSIDTYAPDYTFIQFGVSQMYASIVYHKDITPEFADIWNNYIRDSNSYSDPLISIDIYNTSADGNSTVSFYSYGNASWVDNFRNDDFKTLTEPSGDVENSQFTMIVNQDVSSTNNKSSVLSIVRTIFICIVLGGASMIFSQDATQLVLDPIEKMLEKIKNITQNPLKAAQSEEEQAYILDKINNKHKVFVEEDTNETGMLLKIITKIGGLLAIGFGEAGSELIVKNMSNSGAINPMIPGKKVLAVFGFCDIRNFTDATEVLQEKVMVFVNEIADIVHSRVVQFGGAANKNIGDAFLLVWRVNGKDADELAHLTGEDFNIGIKALKPACIAAELAVSAFVKIMAEMNQSSILTKYNSHEGLRARINGYKVRMGFGLHMGWAIEGAIGSEFKIDASYLSPHVNMASRLEAATKQFGVPILISEVVFHACGAGVQRFLRKIDVVTVKGSEQPIGLFTFDGDFEHLPVHLERKRQQLSEQERKRRKFVDRSTKTQFVDSLFKERATVAGLLEKNKQIQQARLKFSRAFFETWEGGFAAYISGNWSSAREKLAKASEMVAGDGPAKALLEFLAANDNRAPPDWRGYRVLTEK